MKCIVHPDLDEEFFEERVREEDIAFTLLFARGPEDCQKLAEISGLNEGQIREACIGHGSSSMTAGGEEYIVINVKDEFIEENEAATRGLIAHEIMHTVQRDTGLEEEIEESGIAFSGSVMEVLREKGFSEEEAKGFLKEVVSTAVLCLKDIYSNNELVSQGFSDDLEEYYYHMLGIDDYCPMPEFYEKEESLDDVIEAINFELRLIPAWLPFERRGSEKAEKIRERIQECYETNLPETSYYITKIRDLYHDSFEDTERFRDEFFQQILEGAFKIVESKLGDGEE